VFGLGAALLVVALSACSAERRDPLAARQTEPLDVAGTRWSCTWSPDGRLLCLLCEDQLKGMLYAVDPRTAEVRQHGVDGPPGQAFSPDGRRVLYVAATQARRAPTSNQAWNHELWCWDTATGKTTSLHLGEGIQPLVEGHVSPDRQSFLFVAGSQRGSEVYTLRLDNLSVEKVYTCQTAPTPRYVHRFDQARWRADGQILLREDWEEQSPQGTAGFVRHAGWWALKPGEKDPQPVYDTSHPATDVSGVDVSPDGRRAFVRKLPGGDKPRFELVDLVTREARALAQHDFPPYPICWSPDGGSSPTSTARATHWCSSMRPRARHPRRVESVGAASGRGGKGRVGFISRAAADTPPGAPRATRRACSSWTPATASPSLYGASIGLTSTWSSGGSPTPTPSGRPRI
jgi:dipeptidyl aminopeptidase/acylaminoacyl peptidase